MGLLDSIGGLAGGIIGNSRAAGDQQQANELAMAGYQKLLAMGAPPDTAKAIMLQQYKSAGTLTPELEQAINLGPSAAANVQEDPNLRNAQMQALQQYQQAGQTGFTAQDQLNNQRMQNQIAADNQSRQASIIQGAQQRGESGSGASLAAQLLNGQASANNESQQGLQLAAQGNNARLAALGQSAGLGGQIRSQDFSNAQTKANAADQFQRFNVQNQQAVANQNVNAQNQAQQYNLGQNQQISNANVGNANQEALRQNQAQLTDWNNQLRLAQTQAGALAGQAGQYNQQAANTRSQAQQFGQGLGGILQQGGSMAAGMPSFGSSSTSGSSNTNAVDSTNTGSGPQNSSFASPDYESAFNSAHGMAHGGMVPQYANGGQVPSYMGGNGLYGYCEGGMTEDYGNGTKNYQAGGQIPGQDVVPGHDDYVNDKVHVLVSPREGIIPVSIMSKPDAPERAKEFIKGLLASQKMRQ